MKTDSLKRKAITGVKWSIVSTLSDSLLGVVQLTVLANLLRPDDFGLMAIVTLVLGFGHLFSDIGMSNAIIAKQQTTSEQLSSIFWANIIVGIIIFVIFFLSSPLISLLFSDNRLNKIVPLSACIILFVSFSQQYSAILRKNLKFKLVSLIDSVCFATGVLVSIILAYEDFGVYSMVYGEISRNLLRSTLIAFNGLRYFKPHRVIKLKNIREYISFGLYQLGERTLNFFKFQIDQILIGSLAGPHSLGFYNLAIKLVLQPVRRINPVLVRIAFPLFAKIQNNDSQLKKTYLLLINFISIINFPLLFGLFITAKSFVPFFFGPGWNDAVLYIQILSVVGILRSIGNPIGSLILAKDRPDLGFKFNAIILVLQAISIYIGWIFDEMVGIALSVLFMQVVSFIIAYKFLIKRVIGPCFNEYFNAMKLSALISLLMAISIWIFSKLFLFNDVNNYAFILFLQLIAGIFFYFLFSSFFRFKNLSLIYEFKNKSK